MMLPFDALLDRITTYRLVVYVLLGFIGVAALLGYDHLLPFTPLALLGSTVFLVAMCWATNAILARIFAVPTNVESAMITGLILALIIDPIHTANDVQFLGWAAILAMSAKYILAINNKHLFNPAAIAVVITAFTLGDTASWWIATLNMLPVVVIGGLLIVRKARQEDMALWFVAAALGTVVLGSVIQHGDVTQSLKQLLVDTPLVFVAAILLTEPRTAPPTRDWKRVYGILTGVLIVPLVHIGSLYSTPELALVVGNVFAYVVSSKHQVVLKLQRKNKASANVIDFVFKPSHHLAFAPGQYIECTLDHPHADARGNRRYFTLASSPTENSLRLGVRFYPHGSSFKKALHAMDGQTKLLGAQVAGDFILPKDRTQKLVFIAGGIGITPFRSMVKYLLDTNDRRAITLLYVNKTAADILYQDVWNEAYARLGITTLYTLTDSAGIPPNWPGYRGRVTHQMIQAAIPDFRTRTYYLSGPPALVQGYEQVLRHMGVHQRQIKKDFFPGLI